MACIYVGTYAKYSAGSLAGGWINPEDFSCREDFIEACQELHKDEPAPELMFQDWEDIPAGMIAEACVREELWDWLDLSPFQRDLVEAYRANVDPSGSIEQALEEFRGTYQSEAHWAEETLSDSGELQEVPEHLRRYIDFDAYARDAGHNGVSFVNCPDGVHVFS